MTLLAVYICIRCKKEFAAPATTGTGKRYQYCSHRCANAASRSRLHAEVGNVKRGDYKYAGYETRLGMDAADYLDFENVVMNQTEVREMLRSGYFPPGLYLRCDGIRYQVTGRCYSIQKLSLAREGI